MQGLKMAIKDPIVLVFALMTTSQLLGLSFVQFFPTCVLALLGKDCLTNENCSLTQTLGFSTTISLLLAA